MQLILWVTVADYWLIPVQAAEARSREAEEEMRKMKEDMERARWVRYRLVKGRGIR